MLNWEKNTRNRKVAEINYDNLPAIGSFADQRRWLIENQCSIKSTPCKSTPFKSTKKSPAYQSPGNEAIQYCTQLAMYIKCVESAYFFQKTSKDQSEIIAIIRKISQRLRPHHSSMDGEKRALIRKADAILMKFTH
jgi:hypothetical protein